jgi:protein gp37
MSDKSAIEWTDATWNPVTGCSKVSPGCAHCYAERLSLRFGHSLLPWTPANAEENVILHPERLRIPKSWRRPRMVFVNSMSDMWHPLVPPEYIDQVFEVMQRTDRHTYQILTKRPEAMRAWFAGPGSKWAQLRLPNVWLGTSIENNRWVGRADELRETPAAMRFISAEPLLSALPSLNLDGIDWLIVGGESGPGHRPIEVGWVRQLRRMAMDAGTAFFFKQWGGNTPKSGGRELDGRTWDAYPRPAGRDREESWHRGSAGEATSSSAPA